MNKSYLVHLSAAGAYFSLGLLESETWESKYETLSNNFDCGQDSAVIAACECVPALMAAFDYLVTDLQNPPQEVPAYEFWERLGAGYCDLIDLEKGFVEWPQMSDVEALLRERMAAVFCPEDITPDDVEAAVSRFRAAW